MQSITSECTFYPPLAVLFPPWKIPPFIMFRMEKPSQNGRQVQIHEEEEYFPRLSIQQIPGINIL